MSLPRLLIVPEGEARSESLAERRKPFERWAGGDRADDAAEGPALPRFPGVTRAVEAAQVGRSLVSGCDGLDADSWARMRAG